ncbi:MAG: GNAT family N-acetyltransferase [Oscillospiraceae bacterium]|nr:GNAT family N-acetyltransferase [Oscillospiraceae bacterium]
MNTPAIETERLLLRRFRPEDIPALFSIYGDREVNTYLPWRPLASCQEAERLFENEYAAAYREPRGYRYAVCLKADDIPIGYVHVDPEGARDLGYALSRAFWHQGIAVEAARAAAAQAKQDGLPFITATHDVNNPRSGSVMRALGMRYQYTYREQWQPKDIPVTFRLYQLNLDGNETRVYWKYWERYAVHYIEDLS